MIRTSKDEVPCARRDSAREKWSPFSDRNGDRTPTRPHRQQSFEMAAKRVGLGSDRTLAMADDGSMTYIRLDSDPNGYFAISPRGDHVTRPLRAGSKNGVADET